MKFICIGRNYAAHAAELGNAVEDEPVLFLKPETALLPPGHDFYLPEWTQEVHYECEIIFRLGKEGKYVDPLFAPTYLDGIGLGIDFTARDLQNQLKAKGLPWDKAKGFNGSAVVSAFAPMTNFTNLRDIHFELRVNGELRQKGHSANMIHPVEKQLAYASRFFQLKKGDIFFTGTPEGVGPVKPGDQLEAFLQGQSVLKLNIR
jgi:2-keto-4-pentenoate hydratase/2-oxohepta-3-ene-1,7-dioic acid hydratase in catechol pathway